MSEAVRQYFAEELKNERNKGVALGREEGRQEGLAEGREEGHKEGRKDGIAEGIITTLTTLVKDDILTISDAAKRAGMSTEDFKKKTGLA